MPDKLTHNHIPALRFPDFANDGEWEVKRLGEIMQTITPPKKLQSIDYQKSGNYPIIDQSQNYICGYSNDVDALVNRTSEDLIVFGDHTCILKIVDFPFIQGADGIKIIKSKDSNQWDNKYVYQYLQFVPIISSEYKRHFSELKEKSVYYPKNIIEQSRIAACLSALDEMLAATNEKLEQLKAYKKGLMQQLFANPMGYKSLIINDLQIQKLRFPEFRNEKEWEEKKLGEVAIVFQGYGFPEKMQGKGEGKYPFIKVGDISTITNKGRKYINESANYVDDDDIKELKAKPLQKGTVVFAKIGEAIRLNRRVITAKQCMIDNNVAGVKAEQNLLCDDFLYYLMSLIDLAKYAGGVVPAVKKSTIEEISVFIPSLPEQRKIASCLSTMDDQINAYTEKVGLLGQYKKGLMQRMFPQ